VGSNVASVRCTRRAQAQSSLHGIIIILSQLETCRGVPAMPISPALITTAEVSLVGRIGAGGSTTVNTRFVFHYRRTGTANPLAKAPLDTIFQANIAAPIIAMLNVRWTQLTNEVRWIDDAQDQAEPFTHVNVGAIAGDCLNSQAAVFVLFRTGLRGRSYKGGKHFGPFSETDVGNDILLAPALARVQTVATALIAPLVDSNANTWNLTVLSRNLSKLDKNPTTVVKNDVNLIKINQRIGRMNSRQVESVY